MSSIAEALKRAQQDRERLRSPDTSDAGRLAGPAKSEPSLAAVVLKRNGSKAADSLPATRATATTEEAGLASVMNLSPATADAAATTRVAPVAPLSQNPAAAAKASPTTLTTALQNAPARIAPAVRHEQRQAETIVEDYTSKRRLNLPASMVVYHDRAGTVAEQYRKLRDNLMAMSVSSGTRRDCQAMVITSALPGEGKTVTVLNLGLSLVELRANRVLLIDGCLESNGRRPSLSQLLRLHAEKGLAELLAAPTASISAAPAVGNGPAESSTDSIEKLLKPTPWHHLYVLPAGARTTPAAAAALLQSQNLRAILRRLRANFDWILIDAPATATLPDAGLFGACADGMFLAVALHHTPHDKVQGAIRRLRSMNLPVKSCIVTRA